MPNPVKIFDHFLRKFFKRNLNSTHQDWLGRTKPFSNQFGLDRGAAIDRRFMEKFLAAHQDDISGHVLEIGDDQYTYQFGRDLKQTSILAGAARSSRSLCYPNGDLTNHQDLEELGRQNCVIATNVLNFIFDIESAVKGLAYLVEPSRGCVLATLAGLCQVSRFDHERWGDYWRFTDMSVRRVFETYFEQVEVTAYGNAPLAAAFIMGLSQEEVPESLFEHCDSDYQILISVRASKPKFTES